MTKRMQPGFGARSALLSIAMSRAGIRGAQNIFEGADGLGRTYLRSTLDSAALRDGLGQRFHMADLSYKPYPSPHSTHPANPPSLPIPTEPAFNHTPFPPTPLGTTRKQCDPAPS